MDDFVARLSAEFSRPAPTGADRLRFYWLEADGFHARSGCPATATACSRKAESFARTIPLDHELVHGVAHPLGVPLPLFAEGLAVAYEGLRRHRPKERAPAARSLALSPPHYGFK
jgi:hypothetical protein